MPELLPTVIDVIENTLGADISSVDPEQLTDAQIAELGAQVNVFYDRWAIAEVPTDHIRMYSGGWVASNVEAPRAQQTLLTSLLYAHSVVIHDPVADWFDPARERMRSLPPIRYQSGMQLTMSEAQMMAQSGFAREDGERTRTELRRRIGVLALLAPLIRTGVIEPVPHLRFWASAQEAILSSVRHDVRDPDFERLVTNPIDEPPPGTDFTRGLVVQPKGAGPIRTADRVRPYLENPAYYLAKTLAISEGSASRYMPPGATDWALYEHKLVRAGVELRRQEQLDLSIVPALVASELPLFSELEVELVVRARRDDEAFEVWRAGLRRAARGIRAVPSSGSEFGDEAREVLKDELEPAAKKARQELSRSATLRRAARTESFAFVAGAAGIGVAAAMGAGAEIPIAAAGMSRVAQWTLSSLFGRHVNTESAVVASLELRK